MMLKEQTFSIQFLDPESLLAAFLELKQEIQKLHFLIETKFGDSHSPDIELLTRQEVSKYLKVNISTVRNWTNQGILKKYGIGDRVYYKKSEVEAALICLNDDNRNNS